MDNLPVILITGTSRGIGEQLATYFCESNYLVLGCSRSPIHNIKHPHYHHYQANISKEEDVLKMFQNIRTNHKKLDVIVNNAAINLTLSLALMTSSKHALETISVNFMGTFLVSREAAKLMMRSRGGRIINMGSMATRHEVFGESIYTASKAAVIALTRVMAKELFPSGITCNVVAPAAVKTPLMANVNKDALKEVLQRNAISELGTVQEIAHVIKWLALPESGTITGQTIYLGGV